jgi:hypothetical protein
MRGLGDELRTLLFSGCLSSATFEGMQELVALIQTRLPGMAHSFRLCPLLIDSEEILASMED